MQSEIEQMKSLNERVYTTKRAISEELEQVLFEEHKVLDKGFVRVIDYMGNDAAIVRSARVSYGAGTKQKSDDQGLINYLMRNDHTSPFEMCEIKLHIKLPIFVARQWIRHRTASVNEYSARYSVLKNEFYTPDTMHICEQAKDNKQGSGESVNEQYASRVLEMLKMDAMRVYDNYQLMLNADEEGNFIDPSRPQIAREVARINLPLSMYTEWYWKIDLHNLLRFLKLRGSEHAQFEIREYALIIQDLVKKWVPFTYDAFQKYKLESVSLSKNAMHIIRKFVMGEDVSFEDSNLSKGEWNILMKQIGQENRLI